MGLLDDAIREHLELKRVRGADPGEVVRQQREALGSSPHQEGAPQDGGRREEGPIEPDANREAAGVQGVPSEGDELGPDALHEKNTSSAQVGSLRPRAAGSHGVGRGADDVAPLVPEQETAEVDMQVMLGLEEEEQIAEEDTNADHRYKDDARGSDEAEGGLPPAHE
jgi:hypothetical protein